MCWGSSEVDQPVRIWVLDIICRCYHWEWEFCEMPELPGESHHGNLGLTLYPSWGSITPLGYSLCLYTHMAEKWDTLSKSEKGFVLVPPLIKTNGASALLCVCVCGLCSTCSVLEIWWSQQTFPRLMSSLFVRWSIVQAFSFSSGIPPSAGFGKCSIQFVFVFLLSLHN